MAEWTPLKGRVSRLRFNSILYTVLCGFFWRPTQRQKGLISRIIAIACFTLRSLGTRIGWSSEMVELIVTASVRRRLMSTISLGRVIRKLFLVGNDCQ